MMEIDLYRPNVAAVIVSSKYPQKCEIFLAQRIDMPDVWQFPQGGIDEGEHAKKALIRELKEEIGTDQISIIAQYPQWLSYEFPQSARQKMKPFIGQRQCYFLVRLKTCAIINLKTEHPEFINYEFKSLSTIFSTITHFKLPIYKQVIKYFQNEGYL